MYSFCVLDADVEQKLSAMQDRPASNDAEPELVHVGLTGIAESAAMLAAEDRSGEDTSGTPEGDLAVQGSAMILALTCAVTRASGPRSIVRFTKG